MVQESSQGDAVFLGSLRISECNVVHPEQRGGNTTSPHRKGTLCLLCTASSVATPTPISIEEEPAEPEADLNPYAELSPTDTEKELLACMAYSEAGNQSFDGQVAVVQVALNRYMHEAYSGSISDILFSPCQFVVGDYYGSVQMEAVDAALAGHPALDLNTDVVYFSTGSLTYGSYYKTIGDHVFRTYI